MTPIYLDYNATTPVDPEVRELMLPFLADQFGNPSSNHTLGKSAAAAIQRARGEVADLLSCQGEEVIFTSGGTESSNLAIQGIATSRCGGGAGHLIISAIEHPATVQPARWLAENGHALTVIGCNPQGVVDPDDVAAAIQPNTFLVSIMHANNEVGSVQPIRRIADICHDAGVIVHVDAAQSAGKIAVDVSELAADLVTLAGHKLYAPKGIGALYARNGIELAPVIRGAGQERGLSPGTENVSHIVALGAAARLAQQHPGDTAQQMARFRDQLQSGLQDALGLKLTVNAGETERLPNTLSVNFPHVVAADLLAAVPDVCASTGAACHSGATQISATLAAMQVPEEVARGTVRLSVGRFTTTEEIRTAVARLVAAWQEMVSGE